VIDRLVGLIDWVCACVHGSTHTRHGDVHFVRFYQSHDRRRAGAAGEEEEEEAKAPAWDKLRVQVTSISQVATAKNKDGSCKALLGRSAGRGGG
jgi:hypothetical protein